MTLFGINEKKKRGLIVPAMAIMVCAIAMVGLGYAAMTLTSNVTSNSNNTGELMLDMGKTDEYDTISVETGPGKNTTIDGILSIGITNDRNNTDNKIKIDGGCALIKVFGNLTDAVTLSATITSANSAPTITLSLYEVDDDNGTFNSTAVATQSTNGAGFKDGNSQNVVKCGKLYLVAITEIGGNTISYDYKDSQKQKIKDGIVGTVEIPEDGSYKSFSGDCILEYKFTATKTLGS